MKIWFQNRRARERRDREAAQRGQIIQNKQSTATFSGMLWPFSNNIRTPTPPQTFQFGTPTSNSIKWFKHSYSFVELRTVLLFILITVNLYITLFFMSSGIRTMFWFMKNTILDHSFMYSYCMYKWKLKWNISVEAY